MTLIRIKEKHQITLPSGLREAAGLGVGDWLEVKIEKGKITLMPKNLVDRHIAEALKDVEAKRVYGPFDSAKELIKSLREKTKKSKKDSSELR